MEKSRAVSENLLAMGEAAEYVHLDYKSFRAYVAAGLIPSVRYPSLVKRKNGEPRRTRLFRKEALDRFIAENENPETEVGTKIGTKTTVPSTRNYPKGWHETILAARGKHG